MELFKYWVKTNFLNFFFFETGFPKIILFYIDNMDVYCTQVLLPNFLNFQKNPGFLCFIIFRKKTFLTKCLNLYINNFNFQIPYNIIYI